MIKKNRIVVDYSLSVLERDKASKLIKEYKKEYIKPYDFILFIRKVAVTIFAFAALFNVIILVQPILKTAPGGHFLDGDKIFNIITLGLFGVALLLFEIYDVVINKAMNRRAKLEQEDEETIRKVKLNRYFIESITNTESGKVYWKNIKDCYRKEGFIFIHMMGDGCVVIPERIFSSQREIAEMFDFIKMQITQNK